MAGPPLYYMRSKLHPYRHALDTAHKVGTQSFQRAGRFHILDVFEQYTEYHLELEAGEVGSEAKVLANPERNMWIGVRRVMSNLNGSLKTSSSQLADG